MNNFKKKISLLYRMTARLNLYTTRSKVKKERVLKEMNEIKGLADEIIKVMN